MDLPLEILEAFVDAVANNKSYMDLASCLSVSRGFRQRSRQHIFATIDLKFSSPDNPEERQESYDRDLKRLALLRQLISNKHTNSEDNSILPHIRSLRIRIYDLPYFHPFEDNNDLSHILSRLADSPKLDTLSIHNVDVTMRSLRWHNLRTAFRKNLRSVSRVPSLKMLSVVDIWEIPETFFRGTFITQLELVGLWSRRPSGGAGLGTEYEDENGWTGNLPSPRLISLSLDANSVPSAMEIIPRQNLKELRLFVESSSYSCSKLQDFLQWSHESLSSLTLDFTDLCSGCQLETAAQVFNLEKLTNLSTLSLSYSKSPARGQDQHVHEADGLSPALRFFCSILSTRKQTGIIAAIQLDFHNFGWTDAMSDFGAFSLSAQSLVVWDQLDSILTAPPFTQTSITFISCQSYESPENFSDCLPKLIASGRLRVDVTQ